MLPHVPSDPSLSFCATFIFTVTPVPQLVGPLASASSASQHYLPPGAPFPFLTLPASLQKPQVGPVCWGRQSVPSPFLGLVHVGHTLSFIKDGAFFVFFDI